MDWYRILEVAIGSIIGIATTIILTPYWQNYFIRKGANTADIEDTGEITKIQETIKHTFEQEIAKLDLEHQHKFTFGDQQRQAVYEFNETLYEYFAYSITMIMKPKHWGKDKLETIASDMVDHAVKVSFAAEKLYLFFYGTTTHWQPVNRLIEKVGAIQNDSFNFLQWYADQTDGEKSKQTFFEAGNKIRIQIDDIQKNELAEIRRILNDYLKHIYKVNDGQNIRTIRQH